MNKMRNVFISFDVNDKHMVDFFRRQAKNYNIPFTLRDYSVKYPFRYAWQRKVRNLIYRSSAVIVAIGQYTHTSKAVRWEINEAYRQDKQIIGMRLHRDKSHKIPSAWYKYDKITNWDTYKIANILRHW